MITRNLILVVRANSEWMTLELITKINFSCDKYMVLLLVVVLVLIIVAVVVLRKHEYSALYQRH